MKEMNQIRMVLDNEKERRMVAENETKNLVDVVNLLDQVSAVSFVSVNLI